MLEAQIQSQVTIQVFGDVTGRVVKIAQAVLLLDIGLLVLRIGKCFFDILLHLSVPDFNLLDVDVNHLEHLADAHLICVLLLLELLLLRLLVLNRPLHTLFRLFLEHLIP